MEKAKTLGILGGLGPMAGVCFYEKVTALTKASCDQEHINVILAGLADTPDRTDFILGKSTVDPTPRMVESAKILERAGADVIAMPCNTAHYFYDAIAGSIHIPMLNIIEETLKLLAGKGARKIGLLATEGTIAAGTYPAVAQAHGIEAVRADDIAEHVARTDRRKLIGVADEKYAAIGFERFEYGMHKRYVNH